MSNIAGPSEQARLCKVRHGTAHIFGPKYRIPVLDLRTLCLGASMFRVLAYMPYIQPYVHGHNYEFSVTLLHPIDMMQVCATRFTSTLGTGKSKCYTLYLEYVVTYMKHSYSQLSTIQFYRWTNGNQMTQPHIFLLYGHQVISKQNIAETVRLI